jgi:hypothetical protein
MALVNSTHTTLEDAVNVCLSVLGEAPITAGTVGTSTLQNVKVSKEIIEEVSRDVQSKGWWFNTSGSTITIYPTDSTNDFHSSIPEEARRYITIRSARVMQTRFVTSEELHKFSYNEEQVSFAILTQAHVNQGGSSTSFTAFPTDLKNIGIEEFLFLASTAEEKLLTLRLNTELQTAEKLKAEKNLIDEQVNTQKVQQANTSADISIKGKQGGLVDAQTATEGSRKIDVEADTTLKGKQGGLVDTQVDTEKAKQADISADISIKGKQGSLVDAQTSTEASRKTDIEADTTLKGKQGSLIDTQADTEKVRQSDISADITIKSKQGSLVDAQTATEGSKKLDVEADTDLKGKQGDLLETQVDTEKARQADISADISIKGKQGSLVDAQADTEGAKKIDVEADTTLKGKQGGLIDTQVDTEKARQSDISADIALKGKQGSLVDAQVTDVGADTAIKGAEKLRIEEATDLLQQQFLTEEKETLKREAEESLVRAQTSKTFVEASTQNRLSDAEVDLKDAQTTKLTEETSYIVTEEKNYNNNNGVAISGLSGFKGYRDFRGELRMMGIQEQNFNALPAYKKKELLIDANSMRGARATSNTSNLDILNNILRYIGEDAVTNTLQSSLASEAHALMNKTNEELQARGWWFNTETDVVLNISNGMISYTSTMLNIEVNDVPTTKQKVGTSFVVRNLETKSYNDWSGEVKATIIYKRELDETPQKFQELVEVRTARLLTELYPQSGIDIQRLPRLEQELHTYFKDRQNDQGNYNIFNNFDTATRVGINRSYTLT